MRPGILFGAVSVIILLAAGCGDGAVETAVECTHSDLISQCPAGASARLDAAAQSSCDGAADGSLIEMAGAVTGACSGSGSCQVLCEFAEPCLCGVEMLTKEVVTCRTCTTACGNGICEPGESADGCPSDCGARCIAGVERCNGNNRQVCAQTQVWETLMCPETSVCLLVGESTTDCVPICDPDSAQLWYPDSDGDGYGDIGSPGFEGCARPHESYVANASDCNDTQIAINPDAAEDCDGLDNDCNGQIDDGVTNCCAWEPFASCRGVDARDAVLTGRDLYGIDLVDANLAGADLSGANLSGALLDADLSDANLTNADLTGADLTDAVLRRANLTDAVLADATLTDADMRDATVEAVTWWASGGQAPALSGTVLSGVDLSGASLVGASLAGAELTGASLASADLSGADLSGALLYDVDMSTTILTDVTWGIEQRLRGADLTGQVIQGVDLSGADLRGSVLDGVDFTGSLMKISTASDSQGITTRLTGASAVGAIFDDVVFASASLEGADFSGASFVGATFCASSRDAAVSCMDDAFQGPSRFGYGARLSGTNLAGVILSDQSLPAADLSGADLTGSFFTATRLQYANLAGAALVDTNFDFAWLDNVEWGSAPVLTRLYLHNARLGAAGWSGATITDTTFTYALLEGGDLSGASFVKTQACQSWSPPEDAVPCLALSHVSLAGANLTGTTFVVTNAMAGPVMAHNANFHGATLDGAGLSGVDLQSAWLADASLVSADLTTTNFGGASLRRADLSGATVSQTNVTSADLTGATLTSSDGYIWSATTCSNGRNSDTAPESACNVCGDGTLHSFEECDDGNTAAGDGCDALCIRE